MLWVPDHENILRLSPIARVLFYGLLGWAIEISFTAVVDHVNLAPDHFRLVGYSYLWMFFIWGTAFRTAELEAKAMKARGWTFPLRWVVYMTTAWFWEYTSGFLLRYFTGHCPWDYSHAESNIDGIIRMDYGVCWIMTGMLTELTGPFLDSVAKMASPSRKEQDQDAN